MALIALTACRPAIVAKGARPARGAALVARVAALERASAAPQTAAEPAPAPPAHSPLATPHNFDLLAGRAAML